MLDRHLLLPLAAMLVEGPQQGRPRSGQLVRLVQALVPPHEGLLDEHGAAIALHRGVVGLPYPFTRTFQAHLSPHYLYLYQHVTLCCWKGEGFSENLPA